MVRHSRTMSQAGERPTWSGTMPKAEEVTGLSVVINAHYRKITKLRALLDGRYNVAFSDVRSAFLPAMRHRVLLNFEAQAENVAADSVLAAIANDVKEKDEK